jgi:hypothetical protein
MKQFRHCRFILKVLVGGEGLRVGGEGKLEFGGRGGELDGLLGVDEREEGDEGA